MNSIEAVQKILSEIRLETVTVNLHKDGDFDFFIKVSPMTSFYAFRYSLDGMGVGIRQHEREVSSFWNLEDFGVDQQSERNEDLVRLFLEIYNGGKFFKILNGKAMTSFVFSDSSYLDFSIYEILEMCPEFNEKLYR